MMRLLVSTMVLLFGARAIADDKKAEPLSKEAKKELEKFQGEWLLTAGEKAGKKVDVGDAKLVLEIRGAKWIFTGQEKGEFIAIALDTDPKCFDLMSAEKATKGQVREGIYKIEGDTLTVCIHEGKEKQRPTRFETKAEQAETILAVFKKVKKE